MPRLICLISTTIRSAPSVRNQADAYHAGLERTFDLLANFPRIGASVSDIAPGHRRFRFQAHIVFYTEDPDGVVIRVILHHSREIRPDLFD